jgi:hypothetical protein
MVKLECYSIGIQTNEFEKDSLSWHKFFISMVCMPYFQKYFI